MTDLEALFLLYQNKNKLTSKHSCICIKAEAEAEGSELHKFSHHAKSHRNLTELGWDTPTGIAATKRKELVVEQCGFERVGSLLVCLLVG